MNKDSKENVFDRAVKFAAEAHSGMKRKGTGMPYILHPLEVAVIAGTMTPDPEVLAAAVLHDTVEDTPVTSEEIRAEFGDRVAMLVEAETEDKREGTPPSESWQIRKDESLDELKNASDPGVSVMWLADKLSNIRSFVRLKEERGDDLWELFNQRDAKKQAWYYRTVAAYTSHLSGTDAWKEYVALTEKVFDGLM